MKNLTSSVYSFEKLRTGGYLYVDKTEFIWNLINPAGESYFLSRPRRFGKSLTISTLKAVFEGKKELFKGLAIYDKPYDWKPYPVIHLDMANCDVHTEDDLRDYLVRIMQRLAKQHGVNVEIQRKQLSSSFGELIEEIAKNTQAVILLDEYDKPILENITNPDVLTIRDTLADFYSAIKKEMDYERFVFITGVSKFCHVSLFSKLNNLTDITMDARYATMLGYTQAEFESNFREQIEAEEKKQSLCHADFLAEIKNWYDGFRFHADSDSVYNPVSLANFFEKGGEFNNYWFETGTPTSLLKLIRKHKFNLEEALKSPVSGFAFSAYEIDKLNPLTLLLQTGYLTIDKALKRYGDTVYMLRFPNLEVKGSFEAYLAGDCSGLMVDQVKDSVFTLADKVTAGDVDGFMETMKVFFAKVPYNVHLKDENNFQLLFFSIFMLLGISIEAESNTNNGRIDAVASNEGFVFVFEFKLNKTDKIALQQIKDRDYYRRYMNSGKKIFLIGVSFDPEVGQIDSWTHEAI
ncbi:MAG: AAA family ATPase [Lentisphaeria bacterium]|nr:AAA family ATPase [Lentisphaeria bacterium]